MRGGEKLESILPLIVAGAGFLVIGFIVGHNKGFSDGFDYAVANSDEVSKKLAEEVMKSATMRIFKKEEDGRLTEVDKIGDEPTE